jgi:hypothetical protein
MGQPTKFTKKYWEREKPKVVVLGKNVLKLFLENGKIQVFPKVDTAPNGVGRGSTIDLEHMNKKDLENLIHVIQYAVTEYGKIKHKQSF